SFKGYRLHVEYTPVVDGKNCLNLKTGQSQWQPLGTLWSFEPQEMVCLFTSAEHEERIRQPLRWSIDLQFPTFSAEGAKQEKFLISGTTCWLPQARDIDDRLGCQSEAVLFTNCSGDESR
ncbi:MAG: hypothetical protein ACOVRM_02140, partial [Planctomycetaceae bacterium]